MSHKDRICKYLENKGLSKRQFLIATGLPVGYFSQNSGRGVTLNSLQKIVSVYPDINIYYIMSGVGSPVLPDGWERYPTHEAALLQLKKHKTGNADEVSEADK